MAITLAAYLAQQNASVIAACADLRWCLSAASSATVLEDIAARRGRSVVTLAGYDHADALVITHAGHAELWVRARMSSYTAAFRAFAQQLYGLPLAGVPAGYNVDHVFSKGRVQTPSGLQDDRLPVTTLVRMLLVDSSVNKSFGGLMESAVVGFGNPERDVRRFDYLQLAKALSIDANLGGGGFGGTNLSGNFGHVVAEFLRHGVDTAFGMDANALMSALMNMAEKVNFARARA